MRKSNTLFQNKRNGGRRAFAGKGNPRQDYCAMVHSIVSDKLNHIFANTVLGKLLVGNGWCV